MKYTERISNKLNELLVKNYDAEKWYVNASDKVNDESLKFYFNKKAREHKEFAKALKEEILRYGQKSDDSGTFKAAIERKWMDLKALFSSISDDDILEEARKGEYASLEEYKDILEDRTLPPSIGSLLLKQREAVQATINSEKVKEELVS